MKKENKDQLHSLLNSHKANVDRLSNLRKENEDKREQFLQAFEQIAKTEIEPVMQKYAEEVTSFGHYVNINYMPAERKKQGGKAANITMTICIDSDHMKTGTHPYISFYAHEYSQKISISVNTIRPNSGGTRSDIQKDLEIDKLTSDFIEQQIMQGISDIFNNKF